MVNRPKTARYLIDTCSLTELRRVYPEAIFRPAWQLIEQIAADGRLLSVEDVLIEIDAQDDELADWAHAHSKIFLPLSEEIQGRAREILASHPTLVHVTKRKSSADPFLIAAAIIHGATVVTQEKRSGGPPAVKIPDVCAAYQVPCIPLLEMFQAEHLKTT